MNINTGEIKTCDEKELINSDWVPVMAPAKGTVFKIGEFYWEVTSARIRDGKPGKLYMKAKAIDQRVKGE